MFDPEEGVKKIVRVGEPSRVYIVIAWVAVVMAVVNLNSIIFHIYVNTEIEMIRSSTSMELSRRKLDLVDTLNRSKLKILGHFLNNREKNTNICKNKFISIFIKIIVWYLT